VNKSGNFQANSSQARGKINLGSTNILEGKKPDSNYIRLKIARVSIDTLIDTGACQIIDERVSSENFTVGHNTDSRQG